jgi:hypothetical protein
MLHSKRVPEAEHIIEILQTRLQLQVQAQS